MTPQLKQRIAKFERTFEHLEDDFEDFDDDVVRVPNMTAARYEKFLDRRAATPFGKVFAEFRSFAIESLIKGYVS
jgi:hypothetical protein